MTTKQKPSESDVTKTASSSVQKTNRKRTLQGVQSQRPKVNVPLGTKPSTAPKSGKGGQSGGSGGSAGSGSYPYFVYNGGPVVSNPQVYNIFLGNWTSSADQTRATHLNQFITDLMNSSFMNNLAQYGTGSSGTFKQGVFIANTNTSLLDSQLQTIIQTAINNSTVPEPAPNSNIVYIVFLDDSTGINDASAGFVMCEAGSNEAFGYHSFFPTTAGNSAYYAVVPGLTNACLADGCPGGNSGCSLNTSMTQEQRQTKVVSHEFTEMITDPEVNSSYAWNDPTDFNSGEDGDICNFLTPGTITVGSNTWTIQPIYSKTDDMQTNGATTCIFGAPNPYPSLLPTLTLIVDRSTFGKDEVSALISSNGSALYTDAFYVVLYGFSPDELQLNSGNLNSPPNVPTFTGSPFAGLSGVKISFDATTGVQLEDVTQIQMIQNIVFPFNITFTGTGAFSGVPASPGSQEYDLTATIALTPFGNYPELNVTRTDTAPFELVLQADPYMMAGETWYLSNDMRVFSVTPAALMPGQTPLKNSTTAFTTPNAYIQALIGELNTFYNTNATSVEHPFDTISTGEDQTALELSQNVSGQAVYNFGLARVHLQGDTATNVRAFFRLFISSSPDTTYDQSTTFRRHPQTDTTGTNIPGTEVPLLGFTTSDMPSTIPFFAAQRIISTSVSMTTQPDASNIQTIPDPAITPAPAPGSLVTAYFGCYLDINQPTPQFPINPSTASTTDGPWKLSEILPIPALIMGNHACLVTEIAYDPDPIPATANAASSDKLGQRNLAWGSSSAGGSAAARAVPTTFNLQAPRETVAGSMPDVLMIEWGNTPPGSIASIYWPQVSADTVIELASTLTPVKALTKADSNTIQCQTGSVTFIPIPPSTSPNLAGLITLDLPSTIFAYQEFNIIVKRISTRSTSPILDNNRVPVPSRSSRYVVGAFEIRVPVSPASSLLANEENLLAVFKWKLEQIPTSNKWYPVLTRLINQVIGKVNGYGGNGSLVPPSLEGYGGPGKHHGGHGQPGSGHGGHELLEHTGKVISLSYDRFGDFEKFHFRTECGAELVFRSDEAEIERLVKYAWEKRIVVTVFAERHHPLVPTALIFRRYPLLEA